MSNSTSTATSTDVPTSSTSQTPSATSSASDPSSSIANSSPPAASSTDSTSSSTTSQFTSSTTSQQSSSQSSTSSSTSTTPSSTSSTPSTSSSSQSVFTSVKTVTPTTSGGQTTTEFVTSTQSPNTTSTPTTSSTSSSSSSSGTAGLQESGKSTGSSGLTGGGKIAVAVVVPIVAVALIVLAALYLWRKRKQRKDAEELRRKEVEEYGYNPNNDPTLPAVAGSSAGHDGPFEMREEGSSGYRGWGTTAVASSGRKASTTLSGGNSAGGIGMAYSEGTSPTHGPVSDTRSDNPLVDGRPLSTEAEALGAMGPAALANRSGDINRGPSNASSSYSAANRSDGSGEAGAGGVGGSTPYYNNQYDTGNPYGETQYGSPPGRAEMSGQPVIRDVQARRNTRIENPSHFPQQSAGISQNF